MMSRNFLLSGLSFTFGLALGAQVAGAGPGITSYGSNSDTAFSVGIQYDFGDMQPDLVAGVRSTRTDSGNDVTGVKLDVAMPLMNGIGQPIVRVMGLAGSTDVQGEAGVGYDFRKSQPLLGFGVQGHYLNGGTNYDLNGKFTPYIGVNTLKKAPSRVELSPVC